MNALKYQLLNLCYLHCFVFRVIATDIEDAKLKLAKEMGADITVNTKTKDLKEVFITI